MDGRGSHHNPTAGPTATAPMLLHRRVHRSGGPAIAASTGPCPRDPDRVARARRRLPPPAAEETLARLRTVLCEPARCGIVRALGAGPLPVEELAAVIGRAPPATSQHLRVLRELGLVAARRVGNARYYELRPGELADHIETILRAVMHTVT